jgi:uncharacterized lipoprotein YddW (UPF0748 family)
MNKYAMTIGLIFFSLLSGAYPEEKPVRAVWIPDPSHTSALQTYDKVLKTIDLLHELQLNTIFVCTWAKGKTIYPSPVLQKRAGYKTADEGWLMKEYMNDYNFPLKSPTGDPLKDLAREARKKNIRVILWFEYGFMASHGPTPEIHPLLENNPQWASKGNDGKQSNYNKTDYYFNAYHPDLQQFMLDLIREALTLYPEVDGIQGDDRMPAMPRNSGYDEYTVEKYKKEHGGAEPPADFNNEQWVRWRLDILNRFGAEMHNTIKQASSEKQMCFSPNPYPWCMENLMQEWPQWIEAGIVDLLSVQCYRNTIEAYKTTVETASKYAGEKTDKRILNPGIILKNGSKIMSKELLIQQLEANKKLKTNGEAFFYNEGLWYKDVQEVLKMNYQFKD